MDGWMDYVCGELHKDMQTYAQHTFCSVYIMFILCTWTRSVGFQHLVESIP